MEFQLAFQDIDKFHTFMAVKEPIVPCGLFEIDQKRFDLFVAYPRGQRLVKISLYGITPGPSLA